MTTHSHIVFTGEFLDQAAGITIERPHLDSPNSDPLGRIGSIVTLPGDTTRWLIIDQLPQTSWLARKLEAENP